MEIIFFEDKKNFLWGGGNMFLAKVIEEISLWSPGRVEFDASEWFARWHEPYRQLSVPSGKWVKVLGRQGITLIVAPILEIK